MFQGICQMANGSKPTSVTSLSPIGHRLLNPITIEFGAKLMKRAELILAAALSVLILSGTVRERPFSFTLSITTIPPQTPAIPLTRTSTYLVRFGCGTDMCSKPNGIW